VKVWEAQRISSSGAIVLPGVARWHCLNVAPQTEDKVEFWLSWRDIEAFHPVSRRFETKRGQRIEHVTKIAPGYVLARFPGPVVWHNLQDQCPQITGVLRYRRTMEPGILHQDDLAQLRRMASVASDAERRRIEAERISPGDMVALMEGPFSGQRVEVLSIGKGRAAFAIRMFGAEDLPASAPLSALVKAAE